MITKEHILRWLERYGTLLADKREHLTQSGRGYRRRGPRDQHGPWL